MAIPVSEQRLSRRIETFFSNARTLQSYLTEAKSVMESRSVSANQILELYTTVFQVIREANALRAAASQVNKRLREELGNTDFDIEAAAVDFVNACQTLVDWVEANFPQDADGWLLIQKLNNGSVDTRAFDSKATEQLRAEIDNVLATLV